MGFDKATIRIEGTPLARRIAVAMRAVLEPVVEVGPGRSGVPVVVDDRPRRGPLAAAAAGHRALLELGHHGPVVLVACDLPLLDSAVIRLLADWPGVSSVVPVVGGRPQPLCARWSRRDLDMVPALLTNGARSMRPLLSLPGVRLLDEGAWSCAAGADAFADADRPEDLDRLALDWSPPWSPVTGDG
jgi:molybdopterin-guanine dinucleotide biosynthesis protein A